MADLMTWRRLLNPGRLGKENEAAEGSAMRSEFHRDYDRIAFSHPFRRLSDKTQVHPLSTNDHVHSRLTHSLEVSIVGRSLGMAVGEQLVDLPDGVGGMELGQILQAACLMHDLGNPPFGHAGEDAIQMWFADPKNAPLVDGLSENELQDFQCFEGNAQAFRLVAQVEHNPGAGGMQLTYATLATLMKYPWTSDCAGKKKKFNAFQSEQLLLNEVAEQVGLLQDDSGRFCRHPLAFLAEAADDICYRIIDLEDAVEIGLLRFDEVREIYEGICGVQADSAQSERNQLSYLRARSINAAVQAVANAFAQHEKAFLCGEIPFKTDLISLCPQGIREALDHAEQFAQKYVYTDSRKLGLQLGGYTLLGELLELFVRATRERIAHESISYKGEQLMQVIGFNAPQYGDSIYQALLKVTDYISGMTDPFALRTSQQFKGFGL